VTEGSASPSRPPQLSEGVVLLRRPKYDEEGAKTTHSLARDVVASRAVFQKRISGRLGVSLKLTSHRNFQIMKEMVPKISSSVASVGGEERLRAGFISGIDLRKCLRR
jgi:hypothetical protein